MLPVHLVHVPPPNCLCVSSAPSVSPAIACTAEVVWDTIGHCRRKFTYNLKNHLYNLHTLTPTHTHPFYTHTHTPSTHRHPHPPPRISLVWINQYKRNIFGTIKYRNLTRGYILGTDLKTLFAAHHFNLYD